MKWAAYIRESTEDQGKGYGPEVQVDFCRHVIEGYKGEFCNSGLVEGREHIKSGFIPPKWVYGDIGGHGWDINRIGLRAMLVGAQKQIFDALVVWRQDRLARTGDVMRLIEVLVSFGVRVYLEGKIYTAGDSLTVKVKAMVSEEELNKMATAISGGLQKAKQSGKKIARPPIGFKKTDDMMKYELDAEGEEVVTLKGTGISDEAIAAQLGVSLWKIKRILRNITAFNEGRLEKLLEHQHGLQLERKKRHLEKRRALRKEFRDWLAEIAPGRWE